MTSSSLEAKKGSGTVEEKGARYGNALQAASVGGHEAIVRLLLDKGTDQGHLI